MKMSFTKTVVALLFLLPFTSLFEGTPFAASLPIQACMYCYSKDSKAGFMYSYSYCPTTQTCVADVWNKINSWCDGGWVDGYTLDLDKDCNTYNSEPIVFTSINSFDGYAQSKKISIMPGFTQEI